MMMASYLQNKKVTVIVRGIGDVGSAVACKLVEAGYQVIVHENRRPRSIRRKMSFCDAYWKGEAELAGVTMGRVETLDEIETLTSDVALFCGSFAELSNQVDADIIVDARIFKKKPVPTYRGRAGLTIAVGPMFQAGQHVDLVIESCWGRNLGRVVCTGQAEEPVNEPPAINGVGWKRFMRASQTGVLQTFRDIGDPVQEGEIIAAIGAQKLVAPLSGVVRGMLESGLQVERGEKIAEIDPRVSEARFEGLAERPEVIANGVLRAVEEYGTTMGREAMARNGLRGMDIIDQPSHQRI